MANYRYIFLDKNLSSEEFVSLVVELKDKFLGPRWRVGIVQSTEEVLTCDIVVPDTAVYTQKEANKRWLAVGESVGFVVSLHAPGDYDGILALPEGYADRPKIAFRGSSHKFENWASGCLMEAFSDYLDKDVYADATEEFSREKYYGVHKTFKAFVSSFYKKLGPKDVKDMEKRYKFLAPEGFWE